MRSRSGVKWIVGVLVVAAVAVGVFLHGRGRETTVGDPRARHVVVISLDTTRRDHFGCYGNEWIRTPNTDALAAESILLTDYMTVVTSTLASHTSLFTGKYPHSHGVPRNGYMVSGDNVMLAELLKEAGFYTAGFIGAFVLDERFNFAQGFDHYDADFGSLAGPAGVPKNERTAGVVTNAAISHLDRVGVPEHLFLFVHYFDPHAPYLPPPPYNATYGGEDGPQTIRVGAHPGLATGACTESEVQQIYRYAGEVSYVDEQLGRLLAYLKKRGILDEALLVVTSDHGENLGDVPGIGFDHGQTVYGFEERAVCMIRLPGAEAAGTQHASLTASVDILPTLTRYLGLPTPTGLDGVRLDLLNPESSAGERTRFSEATKPWGRVEAEGRWFNYHKSRCVRSGRYKYIQTLFLGKEELYDLAADPHERNNLLASGTPEVAAIAADLREKLQAWAASATPLPTCLEPVQSAETMQRLRTLGYVGPDEGGGD